MNIPPRGVPTPRARRIWEEIETLTLYDLLYLRDRMRAALDEDPEGQTGVREPRRPRRPSHGGVVALSPPYEETG